MKNVSELLCSLDESWMRFSAIWRKTHAKASEPCVHDLRVAARRLSARLDLVGSVIGNDDVSPAKKQVRKALKRLGALRDMHVQMEMIAAASQDPVAKDFRRYLKRAASREVPDVERYLQEERRRQLKEKISALRSGLERLAKESNDDSVQRGIYGTALVRRDKYVGSRRSFDLGVQNSLHPMRIALKKFRYVAEAGQDIVGGWTEHSLKRMQAAQRLMGATRDIEVLMSEFRNWADRHGRQSEVDAILKRLDRKRKSLIARIAKSAGALDVSIPKAAMLPVRETTLAASAGSRTSPERKPRSARNVQTAEQYGVNA